jgi:hypothetical protein
VAAGIPQRNPSDLGELALAKMRTGWPSEPGCAAKDISILEILEEEAWRHGGVGLIKNKATQNERAELPSRWVCNCGPAAWAGS